MTTIQSPVLLCKIRAETGGVLGYVEVLVYKLYKPVRCQLFTVKSTDKTEWVDQHKSTKIDKEKNLTNK